LILNTSLMHWHGICFNDRHDVLTTSSGKIPDLRRSGHLPRNSRCDPHRSPAFHPENRGRPPAPESTKRPDRSDRFGYALAPALPHLKTMRP
jgi:hypothetical protein